MTEVVLPSGAKLKVTPSSFAVSKELFQSVSEEMKSLNISSTTEIDINLFKDLFCTGLSSKKIEKSLWECMKKATYNNLKITEDTFEPVEAREDYIQVMFEVAKENIAPFMKSLFASYADIMKKIPNVQS
jgi:hypothetical protein